MLDTGGLEEPHRRLVTRASSSARRMNQMVLDLVEFTRTRIDDTIPVVCASMDARRLVHDVAMELAASYPESIVLSVHNEGPVITAEQQEAIFREGRRVGTRSTAPDRRHQGLGLYIVERIVAAHGGTVAVRSSPREGTTFTIRLPRTA
jgi:signal transduction histidine kinase